MAEYLARRVASERNLTVDVGSAGTAAWDGAPASDGALLVCLEHDIGHFRRLIEDGGVLQRNAPVTDQQVQDYFGYFYEFILDDRPVTFDAEYASGAVVNGGDLEVVPAVIEDAHDLARRGEARDEGCGGNGGGRRARADREGAGEEEHGQGSHNEPP